MQGVPCPTRIGFIELKREDYDINHRSFTEKHVRPLPKKRIQKGIVSMVRIKWWLDASASPATLLSRTALQSHIATNLTQHDGTTKTPRQKDRVKRNTVQQSRHANIRHNSKNGI